MIDALLAYNNDLFPFSTPPLPLTILNMILIWMNLLDKRKDMANWSVGLMFILSFIPLINAITLLTFTLYNMSVPVDKRFFRKKENKLEELNTLIQCNHCEVMFRKGYIEEENQCPICENHNDTFLKVTNQKVYDAKIPEQAKIKTIKNKNNNDDLLQEQNELYLKAKEERIRKNNDNKKE